MLAQPQVGGIWDTESENLFSKTLWHKLRKIAKQSPAERRQVIRGATGCRVPLDAKNATPSKKTVAFSCHSVPDYRTFIEDYLKIVEFIEWLKEYYPEKATFLAKKP